MKKFRLAIVIAFAFVTITAVSSTIEETEFFKENPLIGDDGRITKSKHFVDGSDSCTQFEIEVTEGGNYLVNFWLLSTQLSDGSFCSYRVKVNDAELNNVKLESGKYSFPINVSNHGIYYVRTIIDGEWVVKKIII